jgi:adenylosuccinate synthase
VVIECSQGTHLSLALSHDYPCCTSDNCTTVAAADDVGLNWQYIKDVIMIIKAAPTRVGTGPLPGEMPPEEIQKRGIAEYGVTTGRLRRKTETLSWNLLEESVMLNGPTQLALTFCDHIDPAISHKRQVNEITPKILHLVSQLEKRLNVPVAFIETGKFFEDIIDLS